MKHTELLGEKAKCHQLLHNLIKQCLLVITVSFSDWWGLTPPAWGTGPAWGRI